MPYVPTPQNTPWQQSNDFDKSKTAVLVIDVLGGSEGITPGLEEMADNSVAIAKAARAAGMPVVFTCDAHLPGIDRELELWGDHGIAGSEAARPLAAFEIGDRDYVLPKRRYDGFFQTDLELTLRELGVDTLIAVGCDTNICVLQTLAGAYFRGFKTIVPADATATFLVGTQEAGLEYFTRCYDARVTTTEALLELL
jgi:nicotinamidase-related amidase